MPKMREYVGFIWIGDEPGIRLRLLAEDLEAAEALVVAEYGSGHVISIRNEDDANRLRPR